MVSERGLAKCASETASHLKQDAHNAVMASLCCNMEGCDAASCRGVHVCPHVYQALQELITTCRFSQVAETSPTSTI